MSDIEEIGDIIDLTSTNPGEIIEVDLVAEDVVPEIKEEYEMNDYAAGNGIPEIKKYTLTEEDAGNGIPEIKEEYEMNDYAAGNGLSEIKEEYEMNDYTAGDGIPKIKEKYTLTEDSFEKDYTFKKENDKEKHMLTEEDKKYTLTEEDFEKAAALSYNQFEGINYSPRVSTDNVQYDEPQIITADVNLEDLIPPGLIDDSSLVADLRELLGTSQSQMSQIDVINRDISELVEDVPDEEMIIKIEENYDDIEETWFERFCGLSEMFNEKFVDAVLVSVEKTVGASRMLISASKTFAWLATTGFIMVALAPLIEIESARIEEAQMAHQRQMLASSGSQAMQPGSLNPSPIPGAQKDQFDL